MDIPDRIIDEDDAKVFSIQSTVFVFDNERQNVMCGEWDGCRLIFTNPVPVQNSEYKTIGCANLELIGKELVATFLLDSSTPERFDIETQAVKLYPFVNAQTTCVYENSVNKYVKMNIESICLTPNQGLDDRVLPLGN